MPTGSGLDAQVGFGEETSWSTEATVTRFLEFNSEGLQLEPTFLEPTGLRAGQKYKRIARVRQSRRTVTGEAALEHATKGMGLLWKHALASAASAPGSIAPGAFQQIHTPGDFLGLGLTVQVGRPEPSSGTVHPFTFLGCKIASWQFSLTDGEVPSLTLTVDGRDEKTDTVLATASYLAGAEIFDFSQATLKLGGTPSTAGGETTVTGGSAVATIITELSISGESPKAVERFGVGNAGLKAEQLENDTPMVTGELSAEFNKTEFYDLFSGNLETTLQLTFTGDQIGASGEFDTLDFIIPAVLLKTATPTVEGPDIVQMATSFEGYANEADPVIQVRIVSDESSL